jgi:hypothetical protein
MHNAIQACSKVKLDVFFSGPPQGAAVTTAVIAAVSE